MPMENLKISSGAMVCEDRVEIMGDVTIGTRTLVHPNVKIIAQAGPIIIGENNVIEEQTVIVNKSPDNDPNNSSKQILMIIGDNNVFEVGSCKLSALLFLGDCGVMVSIAIQISYRADYRRFESRCWNI
jgi:dynactin-6